MTDATDQAGTDQQPFRSVLGAMASRRAFLAGAVATAGITLLDPRQLAAARRRAAALPAGDLFALGVASGDPTADGFILWTRVLSPVPGTPLPPADIAVDWEVATDEAFTDVVASGTAPAVAALAHSVHVDVTGLEPDNFYWYRFSTDARTSSIGRARTFPGAGTTPNLVRFALATCQNWSDGYYTAHAGIATEDIDFVVFVGDYIYEKSADRQPRPISIPESVDLPTYRARYELYKSDPNLQAAHRWAPWITTVDDHEVANNMIAGIGKDGADVGNPTAIAAWLARRADAYQAWYEHQPVRLPAPGGADYRIYRTVEHSDLLRFFVLDGRQYRSAYPTGTESQGIDDPRRFDEDRTMLGADQESWLDGQFAATTARWNVVAQQTVMTATPIPVGDATFFNYDQWDGYVAARNRLLHALVDHRVRNPMVLSGDIHLAAAGGVRVDYEDPDAPDVANEVVTTSISSRFDDAFLDLFQNALAQAPWARYGNAVDRGYAVITLTADEWRTDFRVVDVKVPTAAVRTDFTDVVAAREPVTLPPSTPTPPPAGPAPAPGATPVAGAPSFTG